MEIEGIKEEEDYLLDKDKSRIKEDDKIEVNFLIYKRSV